METLSKVFGRVLGWPVTIANEIVFPMSVADGTRPAARAGQASIGFRYVDGAQREANTNGAPETDFVPIYIFVAVSGVAALFILGGK